MESIVHLRVLLVPEEQRRRLGARRRPTSVDAEERGRPSGGALDVRRRVGIRRERCVGGRRRKPGVRVRGREKGRLRDSRRNGLVLEEREEGGSRQRSIALVPASIGSVSPSRARARGRGDEGKRHCRAAAARPPILGRRPSLHLPLCCPSRGRPRRTMDSPSKGRRRFRSRSSPPPARQRHEPGAGTGSAGLGAAAAGK